ncbi:SDR family NAD(P)-dependent oxidoreductase [Actinomadura madurae]|nr:SDR family NAD(P)-dependent oxidoreductase [Actinomadura madurae]MCP9948159.1 SDR family NAD(P)-dependent oxidoreductase [Actinomadura madurae]
MRGLQDKVIVVAGGATGIGAATARRLAEEGAKVVIGDINPTGAKDTVEEIRAHGGHAVAHEFDISSEESCAALMAAAVEAFGGSTGCSTWPPTCPPTPWAAMRTSSPYRWRCGTAASRST